MLGDSHLVTFFIVIFTYRIENFIDVLVSLSNNSMYIFLIYLWLAKKFRSLMGSFFSLRQIQVEKLANLQYKMSNNKEIFFRNAVNLFLNGSKLFYLILFFYFLYLLNCFLRSAITRDFETVDSELNFYI